jgi:hypothetical protein
MKMKGLIMAAVFAVMALCASPALAAPGKVGSTSAQQASVSPFTQVAATGTVTNIATGVVSQVGSLRIDRFAVENGRLVAIAAVRDATGQLLTTVPIPVQNVNVAGGQASSMSFQQRRCRILHLELGPLDLNLLGLRIQLNRVVLDITAERGPGNLLGNLLCAIAGLLNGPTPNLQQIARRLNRLIGLLGPSPFVGVPAGGSVTNIATGAVSQVASLDVVRFALEGGQVVALTRLRDSAGRVLATVPIPVQNMQVAGGASGVQLQQLSCRILHLELGPLDLNLLGLRIQLSRVVLDITAERGPGNLLGNLLCAIAGLLNGNPTAGLVALLNRILGINGTNPFADIPATGTATRGSTVTQIASANVLRFAARRGRLLAITQLRDAAGQVIATVPIPVLRPNARFQQRPSCRILHLDLAPIDLNILGLRIQTSRIVLDITAEPGPGNLLGNLLCAIARLLDRSPLQAAPAIANRLNRAIRLYA